MKVVVIYADQPEAGKSTVAQSFIDHGYKPVALATPLKEMLMMYLMNSGIPMAEARRYIYGDQKHIIIPKLGVTGRHLMRTLGTEWGRVQIGPEAWFPALRESLAFHKGNECNVVIDDVRHRNEAMMLSTEFKATFIKVERPGHVSDTSHSSEGELRFWPADVHLLNDGSLDDLKAKIHARFN